MQGACPWRELRSYTFYYQWVHLIRQPDWGVRMAWRAREIARCVRGNAHGCAESRMGCTLLRRRGRERGGPRLPRPARWVRADREGRARNAVRCRAWRGRVSGGPRLPRPARWVRADREGRARNDSRGAWWGLAVEVMVAWKEERQEAIRKPARRSRGSCIRSEGVQPLATVRAP